MIHSRVGWMSGPVERSMTVSAPQRVAQVSFSTSSSMDEDTAELPILALTFTRKLEPMIMGSVSGWLTLAGRMDRPEAISSRTNTDRKSTRLNSSHPNISDAVFCLENIQDVPRLVTQAKLQGRFDRAQHRLASRRVVFYGAWGDRLLYPFYPRRCCPR